MEFSSELLPTNDLLEFYKKKVFQHEKAQDDLDEFLGKCKLLSSPIQDIETFNKLNNELIELRSALSDLNVIIHSERQQSAQLLLEREQLKIDLETANRKISLLSSLTNLTNEDLETFIHNPKKKKILKHRIPLEFQKNDVCSKGPSLLSDEPTTQKEVALQKLLDVHNMHLTKLKNVWQEEKSALMEERDIQQKEFRAQMVETQSHQNLLAGRLDESQKLLQEATRMASHTKGRMLKAERSWATQKEQMATLISKYEKILSSKDYDSNLFSELLCEKSHPKGEIASLQCKLKEHEKLKSIYEERCLILEKEKCKLLEEKEGSQRLFTEMIKKKNERIAFVVKQDEKLEQRLHYQAEGFLTDLNLIKDELKKLIQQFYKLTAFYSQSEDAPDLSLVKDLKNASALARSVHLAIAHSKRKLLAANSDLHSNSL